MKKNQRRGGADGTEGPSIATPNPLALATRQKQRQQINPSTYSHIEQTSEPHRYTKKLLILIKIIETKKQQRRVELRHSGNGSSQKSDERFEAPAPPLGGDTAAL